MKIPIGPRIVNFCENYFCRFKWGLIQCIYSPLKNWADSAYNGGRERQWKVAAFPIQDVP